MNVHARRLQTAVAGLALAMGLLGCRAHPDPLGTACGGGSDSGACLALGRNWLSGAPPSLAQALEREATLRGFRDKWGGDGYTAVHGAFLTRLGGAHAGSGDVVKAVESVDAGLAELEEGRRRFPSSGFLRLTHALTLSHLPDIFRKRGAAADSLDAISRDRNLSDGERALVDQARKRIASGRDSE